MLLFKVRRLPSLAREYWIGLFCLFEGKERKSTGQVILLPDKADGMDL